MLTDFPKDEDVGHCQAGTGMQAARLNSPCHLGKSGTFSEPSACTYHIGIKTHAQGVLKLKEHDGRKVRAAWVH